MKKFNFTLQSVKKYNEQVLDGEKNVLSALRADLAQMQAELDRKLVEIEEAQNKLMQMLDKGTYVNRISIQKRYITSLQQDIYRIKGDIVKKQADIEKQLQKVIDATKEVSKLEKIEEKQLEEYKYMEQKENEQFIEEFVSSSSFYEK